MFKMICFTALLLIVPFGEVVAGAVTMRPTWWWRRRWPINWLMRICNNLQSALFKSNQICCCAGWWCAIVDRRRRHGLTDQEAGNENGIREGRIADGWCEQGTNNDSIRVYKQSGFFFFFFFFWCHPRRQTQSEPDLLYPTYLISVSRCNMGTDIAGAAVFYSNPTHTRDGSNRTDHSRPIDYLTKPSISTANWWCRWTTTATTFTSLIIIDRFASTVRNKLKSPNLIFNPLREIICIFIRSEEIASAADTDGDDKLTSPSSASRHWLIHSRHARHAVI